MMARKVGNAVAGFRRGEHKLGEGGGMGGEPLADLREDAVAVLGLDLVGLGQDDLEGDGRGVEKAHDLLVHGLMPWRASISTKARRSVARPAR
jgi:hypothetical protein